MNKLKLIALSAIVAHSHAMALGSRPTPTAASKKFECIAGSVKKSEAESYISQSLIQLKSNNDGIFKKRIPLPDADFYQNRSSHCVVKGSFVYALDKVDTKSQQLSNQTLLYIVKFSLDGKILHREFVNPLPGSDKNISSFVEPGKENFTIDQTGTIHIKGKWKDINNYEDDDHEFSSSVKSF